MTGTADVNKETEDTGISVGAENENKVFILFTSVVPMNVEAASIKINKKSATIVDLIVRILYTYSYAEYQG